MHFIAQFQHKQPTHFLGSPGLSQVSKEFFIIRSHVLGPINNPFPAFSHIKHIILKQKSRIQKTQTAPNFWAVPASLKIPKKILTTRSQVLGPIKRPLTASNQPKHGKTLKNGNKTQVGRKSYLLELSKTPKSGVHALSSPRRTASLLAPSIANGRIARDLREKHSLSLKSSQEISYCIKKMAPTFLLLPNVGDEVMFAILSFVN